MKVAAVYILVICCYGMVGSIAALLYLRRREIETEAFFATWKIAIENAFLPYYAKIDLDATAAHRRLRHAGIFYKKACVWRDKLRRKEVLLTVLMPWLKISSDPRLFIRQKDIDIYYQQYQHIRGREYIGLVGAQIHDAGKSAASKL